MVLEEMSFEYAFSISPKWAQETREVGLQVAFFFLVAIQMSLLPISVVTVVTLEWPLGSCIIKNYKINKTKELRYNIIYKK